MPRSIGRIVGLVVGAALMAMAPVRGSASPTAEGYAQMCERAIVGAARQSGVPEAVLHAIALTETGRNLGGRARPWPWAVNREGKGFWFQGPDEVLAFARQSVADGRRSFDVGCFQINYHWHGHNFPSLESMADPATGAAYAARFLSELYREFGSWSAAAGAYHSRTPHYAGIYRARFDSILAGLGGAPLVVPPAPTGPVMADAAAVEEEPPQDAAPRRSRTRLASAPKIITVERRTTPPASGVEAALPPLLLLASGRRS